MRRSKWFEVKAKKRASLTATNCASQQGDVAIINWVCELEAGLGRLNKLRKRCNFEKKEYLWDDLFTACDAVLQALKRERSRSHTVATAQLKELSA